MKKRNIAVEEHYDDCGEDLSALQGADLCTMAWTDTLMEEAEPVVAENAHHLDCDGLSSFMLFGPCVTPDTKHLKTVAPRHKPHSIHSV